MKVENWLSGNDSSLIGSFDSVVARAQKLLGSVDENRYDLRSVCNMQVCFVESLFGLKI